MNRGADSVLSVYSDARAEYTKQLCVFLVPAYFQFFVELLERAKQDMSKEPKRALWQFQTYLNEIHDWNMEKVSQEIQRIHTNSGCDYLEDLLTAVFIAHTKVLTAIRLSSQHKKVEINIPKVDHFLFKVLCETSKLLWGSTYLFRDDVPSIEKQQNYRGIEGVLNEGILQAVRTLVPVKSILKDFVSQDTPTDTTDTAEEDSDEENDKPSAPASLPASLPAPVSSLAPLALPAPVSSPPVSSLPVSLPLPVSESLAPVPLPVRITLDESLDMSLPAVEEASTNAPIIHLDERPTVRFGEYDAHFDSECPLDSDMVSAREEIEDYSPDLEILEETGTPLAAGLDFDILE